jgi:hypothetical protein
MKAVLCGACLLYSAGCRLTTSDQVTRPWPDSTDGREEAPVSTDASVDQADDEPLDETATLMIL